MRLFLLVALLVISAWPAGPPPPPYAPVADFGGRLARFQWHYNLFVRKYLGCPVDAVAVQQCNPKIGVMDNAEFQRAAKEARGLFSL